jgi:hypothetical protein
MRGRARRGYSRRKKRISRPSPQRPAWRRQVNRHEVLAAHCGPPTVTPSRRELYEAASNHLSVVLLDGLTLELQHCLRGEAGASTPFERDATDGRAVALLRHVGRLARAGAPAIVLLDHMDVLLALQVRWDAPCACAARLTRATATQDAPRGRRQSVRHGRVRALLSCPRVSPPGRPDETAAPASSRAAGAASVLAALLGADLRGAVREQPVLTYVLTRDNSALLARWPTVTPFPPNSVPPRFGANTPCRSRPWTKDQACCAASFTSGSSPSQSGSRAASHSLERSSQSKWQMPR